MSTTRLRKLNTYYYIVFYSTRYDTVHFKPAVAEQLLEQYTVVQYNT